ncbi:MAG: efflux RND transporter periplasmic adaptor subunit [Hyphomicrobium sp.]|jgi:RND family efflux transporter MFP subunit
MSRKFFALAAVATTCAAAGAAVWSTQTDGAARLGHMLKLVGFDASAPLPPTTTTTTTKKDSKPAPRLVRVVSPEPAPGSTLLTLSGRTAPAEQALLSSRANGIVAERRVDIGDRVKAGDILVTIEAPEVEQELRRARATIDQVKARLTLAEISLQRGEDLVDKGHVSVQTVDERRAAKLTAEADLAAAEAEVKRLEEVQSFQTIRAPFDGTIIARHVERGDKVTGVSTQENGNLLRIARLDELRIEIDVPQSSSLLVKPGARAKVAFAELPEELTAHVVRVSGQIEQASSTMRAELLMQNPDGRIPAGLNGQVMIEVSESGSAVTVPTNTLLTRNGRQMVAIVDAQSRFQVRPVSVVRDLGERVVIASGLTASDRVIVSPNALLRVGDEVQLAASAGRAVSAKD